MKRPAEKHFTPNQLDSSSSSVQLCYRGGCGSSIHTVENECAQVAVQNLQRNALCKQTRTVFVTLEFKEVNSPRRRPSCTQSWPNAKWRTRPMSFRRHMPMVAAEPACMRTIMRRPKFNLQNWMPSAYLVPLTKPYKLALRN